MNEETKMILDRLDNIDNRISAMDDKISSMDNKISVMDDRMSSMDDKISAVQLTIENEIRNNIQILAEGHMTLERKLDESLKVNQEKELLLIRVNRLESEVRELKERIERIS